MKNFMLTFYTLRHIRPIQLVYRIKFFIFVLLIKYLPNLVKLYFNSKLPSEIEIRESRQHISWFSRKYPKDRGMFDAKDILDNSFTFLNQTKSFNGNIRWENKDLTYLWDFNLHYFEYLDALSLKLDSSNPEVVRKVSLYIQGILNHWISSNPISFGPGWHSYTLSLRIVNWIKFLTSKKEFADDSINRSLYLQVVYLESNLEKHLLCNHLFENGKALLFAGLYFESKDSDRWFNKGINIVLSEIEEQVLSDGAHFEHSPMYHCIFLQGLLDLYAFLEYTGREIDQIKKTIIKMCGWLDYVECPDGTFPLFNDSALGIAPTVREIFSNAKSFVGYEKLVDKESLRHKDGTYVLENGGLFCVIDGASIGPSYNPGHAHSDNFTYELFYGQKKIITDTGVSTYDPGKKRIYERSTAAHNTLLLNGLEQTEMWSSFRVARRSNPDITKSRYLADSLGFYGKYKNQLRTSINLEHERYIIIGEIGDIHWIVVWDSATAKNYINALNFCHFDPAIKLDHEEGRYKLKVKTSVIGVFHPLMSQKSKIFTTTYSPEFGINLSRQSILMSSSYENKLGTGYLIVFGEDSSSLEPNIEVSGNLLTLEIEKYSNSIQLDKIRE